MHGTASSGCLSRILFCGSVPYSPSIILVSLALSGLVRTCGQAIRATRVCFCEKGINRLQLTLFVSVLTDTYYVRVYANGHSLSGSLS